MTTALVGPIPVLGIPLAVALVLQLMRRWTALSAWLAAITATVVGLMVALMPLTQPVSLGGMEVILGRPLVFLGRQMVIQPVDRLGLAFIFFTAAGLFIVAWRLLPHSNFFPVGLAMATLLAAALMVEQVVYAALLVELAAVLAVFPLHESGGSVSGGLRYMTYATLALPGLMITQLLLDLYASFPNDHGLLDTAAVLMSLSFAILLGAVPFQTWLSTVAMDGSPPVVTFLFTVNIGAVWFLLLAYLQSYTWLWEQASFGTLLSSLGLLMMVVGGILAASQRHLGRLIGYATLVDNGAMLLALGTQRAAGLALAAMLLMARPFALGLMTLGLDGLRRLGRGSDDLTAVTGAVWRSPWRVVAFLVGGIAMAGFPLSLGFTARWGLYRLVAENSFFWALLALAGSAGVMMGLVSSIRSLLAAPRTLAEMSGPVTEDRVVILLILVLIGTTLILGIFPQGFSAVGLQMAESYPFFAP